VSDGSLIRPFAYWNSSEFSYYNIGDYSQDFRAQDSTTAHLPHINGNLATLTDHTRSILPVHPFFQVWQYFRNRYSTKGFSSFMADHVCLVGILQHIEKGGDGMWREQLSKNECNFMSRVWLMARFIARWRCSKILPKQSTIVWESCGKCINSCRSTDVTKGKHGTISFEQGKLRI